VEISPLRITFAESGRGETTYIEFPTGQIGVVDASPSSSKCRLALAKELEGREVAFVCLTHPHKDHGDDLLPLLKTGKVLEFWHSLPEVEPFLYFVTQGTRFRSVVSKFAEQAQIERAQFVLDLWTTLRCRRIECLAFDGSREPIEIGSVMIHFLAPERGVVSREMKRLQSCLNSKKPASDPNSFSLILAIEYVGNLILLGADGLRSTWTAAYAKWNKNKLPKAIVLKVPHHGAKNAFDLRHANQKPLNCWDLCTDRPHAVIFAGDFSHPDPSVHASLIEKTILHSFFDLGATPSDANPLRLHTPGARARSKRIRPQLCCKIVCEFKSTGALEISQS
jgi:hypothetical protein